ncbi:hypothetical protein NAC44_16525 [Allorhizobium sp. BGMRC 0089]|uniref:hypothetical protein n=1 Tax=Allorhizobium sonneratiae TaxID=2934936 RepID=UPI0020343461|nr:hypothetical protein [Allorhizobium sonneratiae]MCM2293932.1 hypothetical protein [Allorhizobium sonneratiae]
MSVLLELNPSGRLTQAAYAAVVAMALFAAAEAHAFCWLYCIHGDQMAFAGDICSSRISH